VPDASDPNDPTDGSDRSDRQVPAPAPTSAAGPEDALEPLDVDGIAAITVGTVAFAVALVVCLVTRTSLADAGRTWWIWVCASGTLLGLAGLVYVRRRAAAYAVRGH